MFIKGTAIYLSNMLRQGFNDGLIFVTTSNLSPQEVCTRGDYYNNNYFLFFY